MSFPPWSVARHVFPRPRLARRLPTAGLGLALVVLARVSAAKASLDLFRREIQPVLEKYCYECHGDGGSKGGVTLDEFDSVAALKNHKLWLTALKNVRAGIMPPADADPLPAAEAEKIMAWIKREGLGLDPTKPDPGRVTVHHSGLSVSYHSGSNPAMVG